jgi:hypothetical protein
MGKEDLKKLFANVKMFFVSIDFSDEGYIGLVSDSEHPFRHVYYTTPLTNTKVKAQKLAKAWLKKTYPNNMKLFKVRVEKEGGYIARVKDGKNKKLLFTSQIFDEVIKARNAATKFMKDTSPEHIAIVSAPDYQIKD